MKRLFFALVCILLSFALNAQAAVSTFDDLTLTGSWVTNYTGPGGGQYYNGSVFANGFPSGDAWFTNSFTDAGTYTYWDGWSVSNTTDATTPGYGNQYSAYTGGGVNGSSNYGVAYVSDYSLSSRLYFGNSSGFYSQPVEGFYVTNTTYAALSMRDGDPYAKKFGGATGNDPDWFKLSVRGVLSDDEYTEWLDFYLADYTYVNNDFDYIIDEWTLFDMRSLGAVIGLEFDLSSSDMGAWGMNTPAYFAMDNLSTVPIPGAIWLLASGIVGLIGLRRKMA